MRARCTDHPTHKIKKYSSLKTALEQSRANSEKVAAHAAAQQQEMQAQLLALQQQLALQPLPGASEGAVSRTAPSREEWVQILEASPLASMQSKLSEVENLLRALLNQKGSPAIDARL